MSANPWYTKVNASALSDEARRLILERVKKKLRFEKTLRALGIARGSLHNYLHGFRTVPDSVVYKALRADESYLEEVLALVE
jgi:transcriptional regulator with XRE-family HTH domain